MTETIWRNSCVGCGEVVITNGGDQPGQCPKCKGWAWLCHWVNPPAKQSTTIKGESDKGMTPGHIITPKTELLPLKPNGNSTPGPKIPTIPDGLIKELAGQGLGAKAIVSRLAEQGIVVSHMTIQRRLRGGLL